MRIRGLSVFVVLVLAATTAHAQVLSTLHVFDPNSGDPLIPGAPSIVAQGRDGNLYSTTALGGSFTNPGGTVFSITPDIPLATLTVLYSFDNTAVSGADPQSGLTLGTDGNFYGTTYTNNSGADCGTVFTITPSGTLTYLYTFSTSNPVCGGSDGSHPLAPPIQGTDGNFYGTTPTGGLGYGTVSQITPSGTLTTIHQFNTLHFEGWQPNAPLIQGTDGNFYGTTYSGGQTSGGQTGFGVAFKITSTGTLTVLHAFDLTGGVGGAGPNAALVQGSDGNFYGTTNIGGIAPFCGLPNGCGTVFQLTPAGSFTVIHSFGRLAGDTDGYAPYGLLQATDGNLYGITLHGGGVYRVSPQGNFSIVHTFVCGIGVGNDGVTPAATPVQHTNGVLYGSTSEGGAGTGCLGGHGIFWSLDVGLGPFVRLVSTSGKAGATVQILGQGLTGTTRVSFGKTRAAFTVVSDTYLTATVPKRARTGFVTVTTPGGTLTSSQTFRVTSAHP